MKMKRTKSRFFLFVLLVTFSICALALPTTAATNTIQIVVNGQTVKPDVAPFMEKDRVLVPIRFITEPLGAMVDWQEPANGKPGVAIIYLNGVTIRLTIGSTVALINGVKTSLDVPAKVVNGRTFVPIRFVSENLDAVVDWEGAKNRVVVASRSGDTSFRYGGYYYDYYSLSAVQDLPNLNQVIHFGYTLQADGTVAQKDNFAGDKFASDGMEAAQSRGIQTLMLITSFDKAISDTVFTNPALRAQAIDNILELLAETGHQGVDLDVEALSVSCRDAYVAFVKELKAALGDDYILSLSLTCRTSDSQTWLDRLDYANLAKYADQCVIMMYDQHYNGGEPGPIAGIDWVEQSLQYLLQYIPRNKLVMGIGAYGRRWPETGTGGAVFFDDCYTLANRYNAEIKRDPVAGVPYFTYIDANDMKQTVYFEDEISIKQKTDLARQYRIAGCTVWRLGRFNSSIWQAVLGQN